MQSLDKDLAAELGAILNPHRRKDGKGTLMQDQKKHMELTWKISDVSYSQLIHSCVGLAHPYMRYPCTVYMPYMTVYRYTL